jgi:hypothetical protein
VPKEPSGFVPLSALTKKPADPQAALADIRHIYFHTTRQTIVHDVAHAIELLKTLESEEQRQKAAVYMEGLAQMRSDWERASKRERTPGSGRSGARRGAAGAAKNRRGR